MQAVGCLLIAERSGTSFERLGMRLAAEDVHIVRVMRSGNLLADAQRGLYAVTRAGKRACVAAEGEMWAAALALGIQLNVDRIVLLFPQECRGIRDRRLEWLKGYVRRNLFFCVSDVLIIEEAGQSACVDKLCRRLINADVWRLHAEEGEAGASDLAAARFLLSENLAQIAKK